MVAGTTTHSDLKTVVVTQLAHTKVDLEGSKGQVARTLEQIQATALVYSKELEDLVQNESF